MISDVKASMLHAGHALDDRTRYAAQVHARVAVRVPHARILMLPHTPLASARRSAANVALLDLAPTILAVAGAAEPERAGLHGRSLVPLLTSDAGSVEPGTGGGACPPRRATLKP